MKTEEQRSRYFNKLIKISEDKKYDPVTFFNWDEDIKPNKFWMSPELLSIYGTSVYDELSEAQLKELSKWELINFFSMSVHGEKNIKMDMLKYLNTTYFKEESDYFIHFLGEENTHIYFFTRFCKQYADKMYSYMSLPIKGYESYDMARYVVFAQTLIAEEIGDYFNINIARDERLPDIIRTINRQHQLDESRHISMGKTLCKSMWQELLETESAEEIKGTQKYLMTFIHNFLKDFYNPDIYRDSGLDSPYEIRESVMQSPSRKDFHLKASKRLLKYLSENKMIDEELYA
jgi:hypothetical protein